MLEIVSRVQIFDCNFDTIAIPKNRAIWVHYCSIVILYKLTLVAQFLSPFIFQLAAIAQVPSLTVIVSVHA